MIALYNQFKDRRADFEILAFHDNTSKTFEELDPKLEKLQSEVWGGELPFPILLDKSGATLRTFGINAFPTIIVVDPDGKLVKQGGEHTVLQYLRETSPKVKQLLGALRGAQTGEDFSKAVGEAVASGGEDAAFALSTYAEKHATKEQIPALAAGLRSVGGDGAVGFFIGKHGLRSEDVRARLAAAQVLAELALGEQWMYTLRKALQAEQDEEVKQALQKVIAKIGAR